MRRIAEHGVEPIEHGRQIGAPGVSGGERGIEVPAPVGQVRAVDGKARGELGNRVDERRFGPRRSRPVVASHVASHPTHLRMQDPVRDVTFAVVNEFVPVAVVSAEPRCDLVEGRLTVRVDEQSIDVAEEVVSGRTVGSPPWRQ